MAHRNIQIPTFKSPPEERENGRDAVLEPDDALLLDCALSQTALPIDCGSEPPKVVTGDALLP